MRRCAAESRECERPQMPSNHPPPRPPRNLRVLCVNSFFFRLQHVDGMKKHIRAALLALLVVLVAPSAPANARAEKPLPIVFVHGNGDNAAAWITTIWRFESN